MTCPCRLPLSHRVSARTHRTYCTGNSGMSKQDKAAEIIRDAVDAKASLKQYKCSVCLYSASDGAKGECVYMLRHAMPLLDGCGAAVMFLLLAKCANASSCRLEMLEQTLKVHLRRWRKGL